MEERSSYGRDYRTVGRRIQDKQQRTGSISSPLGMIQGPSPATIDAALAANILGRPETRVGQDEHCKQRMRYRVNKHSNA